ncbi:MAG: TetR/AcrR family transcriptional regulator [Eubacteriales bacterium]|nr:TetR/AcrR family transcriptional regulator [Eubacteriales bacterium]
MNNQMEHLSNAREQQIFNAVARLVRDGRRPTDLRMAEIAEAAELGKGTLYEYFTSKGDLISRAIHHFLRIQLERLDALIRPDSRLRHIFDQILAEATETATSQLPVIWSLLTSLDPAEPVNCSVRETEILQQLDQMVDRQIHRFMQIGIRQKLISDQNSPRYCRFVLSGVICAYVQARGHLDGPMAGRSAGINPPAVDVSRLLDDAWTMLIRSLGT